VPAAGLCNAGDTPAATAIPSRARPPGAPKRCSRLGRSWRSVSKQAPLQNQFSECPRFGRSRIEEQRRRRGMRVCDEREFIDAKIDGGKFCVVPRPAFRYHRDNCAQDLAALGRGWRRLRLYRLGMKRTSTLCFATSICNRAKRAMIGNCQPGADRDHNDHVARACFHARFNRPRKKNLKCFLSADRSTARPCSQRFLLAPWFYRSRLGLVWLGQTAVVRPASPTASP
jgi:hypothetical protein